MKKMRIEKSLLFQDPVEQVLTLKVTEGFTYKQEEDGIRATGPLFIRGMYESEEQHKFQEILEMDVLAPNEKLSGENFYLEVGEYQGIPSEDGIDVTIMILIHGLREETPQQGEEEAPSLPRHALIKEEETIPLEESEDVVKSTSKIEDKMVMEDLLEDANNVYTSYRMIVAKPNDTYAAIAARYHVEEEALRMTNANKDVQPKTLLILPFDKNSLNK